MKFSSSRHVALAAALVATSSALDFNGRNDVSQTAATVAPDQGADSLTPASGANGFGMFGMPTISPSSGGSVGIGNPGWPQQQQWMPPSQDGETLSVGSSGSSGGAWTPPSGNQGWGTQEMECSGSSDDLLAPSIGDHEWGAEGMECSGSSSVESSSISSTTSSGFDGQSSLQSPTGGSNSATFSGSLPSRDTGSQGWSQAAQTSSTADSSSATSTGSTVGADAEPAQSSNLRPLDTATSSETAQQQEQQQDDSSVAYTDTSGSDVIAYTSEWGSPVVAETSSNHSSAVPTFGDITSKTGKCVTGKPNEYISTEYLDWVWEHRIGPKADLSNESNWNVMANKNWIMDKLVHNNGSMNYCVRWDTDNRLSKEVAVEFQSVLTRHYNAWNKWLEGYNCWPFTEININMVGWAAKDAAQFEWKDNSLGNIYEGFLDPADNVPMCPNECYRFYDNVNNMWSDTSSCKGEPFDISFWLKEDIPYGFGYDWGQEVSLNNTLQNLYDKNVLFVGHEIGHGFGLPDFYDLTQKPSKDFPRSIMMAFSSITITPSDGWMLRRVLDHVRSRYNF